MNWVLLSIGVLNLVASAGILYTMRKTQTTVEITVNNAQKVADDYQAKIKRIAAELAK